MSETCIGDHQADVRNPDLELGYRDAAQLHLGPLRLNKSRTVRLAEYSRDQMINLHDYNVIEYNHRTPDTLQLFRYQKQIDGMVVNIEVLKSDACHTKCWTTQAALQSSRDRHQCASRSPASCVCSMNIPTHCFKFTNKLAKSVEGLDVEYRYNVRV